MVKTIRVRLAPAIKRRLAAGETISDILASIERVGTPGPGRVTARLRYSLPTGATYADVANYRQSRILARSERVAE